MAGANSLGEVAQNLATLNNTIQQELADLTIGAIPGYTDINAGWTLQSGYLVGRGAHTHRMWPIYRFRCHEVPVPATLWFEVREAVPGACGPARVWRDPPSHARRRSRSLPDPPPPPTPGLLHASRFRHALCGRGACQERQEHHPAKPAGRLPGLHVLVHHRLRLCLWRPHRRR